MPLVFYMTIQIPISASNQIFKYIQTLFKTSWLKIQIAEDIFLLRCDRFAQAEVKIHPSRFTRSKYRKGQNLTLLLDNESEQIFKSLCSKNILFRIEWTARVTYRSVPCFWKTAFCGIVEPLTAPNVSFQHLKIIHCSVILSIRIICFHIQMACTAPYTVTFSLVVYIFESLLSFCNLISSILSDCRYWDVKGTFIQKTI